MSIKQKLTGKPSIDRPWMQYYPQEMIENLTVPNSTIYEYLMYNCPGDDVVAIHYYGRDITWKQIKEETDKVARALKAVGFGENDEIPMFLRSVPEFISLINVIVARIYIVPFSINFCCTKEMRVIEIRCFS